MSLVSTSSTLESRWSRTSFEVGLVIVSIRANMKVKEVGIGSSTGLLKYVAMSVGDGNLEGFRGYMTGYKYG